MKSTEEMIALAQDYYCENYCPYLKQNGSCADEHFAGCEVMAGFRKAMS